MNNGAPTQSAATCHRFLSSEIGAVEPTSRRPVVAKVGGGEGIGLGAFCRDAAELIRAGTPLVIVHGGSHAATTLGERLGVPPVFVTSPSGHTSRRTDSESLRIFQMALRGLVSQEIVQRLQALGVNAIGLSGMDGRLWVGPRKDSIRILENGRTRILRDDHTGTVETVNVDLLRLLLGAGFTPVLSPPALSTAGEPINVDADRAAAVTAAALGAEALLLLTNVPGLLREFPNEASLVPRIQRDEIEELSAFAQGRMKKKVLGAAAALEGGVGRVIIADARIDAPISAALAGRGTVMQ